MLEFIGDYASCKVMIDEIETEAISQIYRFLNCPAFEGSQIRIMPDCHYGAGAVIGFTGTLTDKVIPNVVGVDIGCGILACKIGQINYDDVLLEKLDLHIRKTVPSGFSVHADLDRQIDRTADDYRKVAIETGQDDGRVVRSLGSLGGGNHFCELDQDVTTKDIWLTIHSGARNFGLKVCQFHQAKAVKTVGKGHGLDWLEGEDAEHYFRHMQIAQRYASENRKIMAKRILQFFGLNIKNVECVESIHNYIDFEDRIVRKGAISARKDQRLIIPWNMRDGVVIGKGKGNPDWNQSAPHGAGRVLGRGQAKRTLDMEEYTESMAGIWSSCVSPDTIDESPMAYKDCEMIKDAIIDTVEIESVLKPIYNFKAGKG